MSDLGARLKQRMKEEKCSQKTLAEVLGVNSNTVGSWVRGLKEPGIYKIHMACYYLNCNLHWLITGNGEKERVSDNYLDETKLTQKERREIYLNETMPEIIEKLSKFDEKNLKIILNLINSMIEDKDEPGKK
jgi:transcriptional regulator with XRE-family HTH domain